MTAQPTLPAVEPKPRRRLRQPTKCVLRDQLVLAAETLIAERKELAAARDQLDQPEDTMSTETLKVYAMDDETWYAAHSPEEAVQLYTADCDEPCEDGYPRELTDAELDKELPDFDEGERPTGGTTTPRAWLAEASSGFLASTVW